MASGQRMRDLQLRDLQEYTGAHNVGVPQLLRRAYRLGSMQLVFRGGTSPCVSGHSLRLQEWAMLRLVSKRWKAMAESCAGCVSKRWKAMAESCADCVHVSLKGEEWSDQLKTGDIGQPCAQAAFPRLCYVL